jgi:hypothetical protein
MARKTTNDNAPLPRPQFKIIRPPAKGFSRVHLYKIGQSVHFSAANIERGAAGIYRVVALLPDTSGEQQYRIKSTSSPQERVAQESQLSAVELG